MRKSFGAAPESMMSPALCSRYSCPENNGIERRFAGASSL